MERKNIYFISDLHLGATYLKNPRSYEQRVVRWLESIRDDAAELYMLGDILDYWYEYKTVVPRGYIRFFGALASLADSGVDNQGDRRKEVFHVPRRRTRETEAYI